MITTTAEITAYDGRTMTILPKTSLSRELVRKQIRTVEIRFTDGREISAEQRRKIFAIIRDISEWSGHDREYLRYYFMQNFAEERDMPYFSLSDVEKSVAKDFITYLIEFCFECDIPTIDTMLNRTDDISKYLYMCLEHRKCAVCNSRAEVHHIDTVGMGRDREEIVHEGMEAVALCRKHHIEAHSRGQQFMKDNHIYGIKLDRYLCMKLRLKHGGGGNNKLFSRDKQLLQLDCV
ncbi:MAG: putative HNHc nuclease [bacterium]|nr:putative HNHc nuclease [bacterium]